MEVEPRRSFLARTVEGLSAVPLIYLIYQNFANRTSYHQIDDSNARVSPVIGTTASEFISANGMVNDSLANLYNQFRGAYHKRHTRIVMVPVSNGKKTRMQPRTQVYYKWEEPANLPNHNTVEEWTSSQRTLSDKVKALERDSVIGLQNIDGLRVTRERTGVASDGLVSLAIYSPQIAALLLYEEAIAKIRHGHIGKSSASEIVEEQDTSKQITRRSFFKAGAALAGAYVASGFTEDSARKREQGRIILHNEIEEMRQLVSYPDSEAFERYFSTKPEQITGSLRDKIEVSKQALSTNIRESKVNDAFANFVDVGGKSLKTLEEMFADGVPKDVADLVKSTLIFRNLQDKSNSEHRAVYASLGLTGLAVAGTIAGVLIPSELVNEYYANRVEKKDN